MENGLETTLLVNVRNHTKWNTCVKWNHLIMSRYSLALRPFISNAKENNARSFLGVSSLQLKTWHISFLVMWLIIVHSQCTVDWQLFKTIIFLEVTCPSIPVPEHGKRTGLGCSDVNPIYQTLCIFECLTGYKIVAGNEKRICKADGQWTGDELQCEST